MCGLAGAFDLRGGRRFDAVQLDTMTDTLAHRGPDGRGTLVAEGVALGHRRLSIIDIAHASQPMPSEDGRYQIVFNGEIYNYRALKAELEQAGHSFRYNSDTEVLLEGYRAWGERLPSKLTGMFVFAIWDSVEKSLFLARDRFGVKPLYMHETADGWLLFASEMKALLTWPGLSRNVDPRAIDDYFAYGYVPEDKSVLQGVGKLEPAHQMTLRPGRPVQPERYWDLEFAERHHGTLDDMVAEMRQRLEVAVGSRLVADVEVAAFLSGGVDSSTVVAMMARHAGQEFKTLSIGFDEAGFDETAYARQVAETYGTEHFERTVTADDYGLIDTLVDAFDEPFADASAIPTYRVCQLAREHVKVSLSGDGADEAMAGYRRYQLFMNEERVRGLLPGALRRGLFGTLGRIYPKLDQAPRFLRAKTSFQALGMSAADAYGHAVSVTRKDQRAALFSPQLRTRLAGYDADDLYRRTFEEAPADTVLGRAQYTDIRHYLPGDILTKVDRTSMANSLEAREPLLDHHLVEWMAGLPAAMRLNGGTGKYLMKTAVQPLLPAKITARSKRGFVVPIDAWFRGPLAGDVERLRSGSALDKTGWFDMNRVSRWAHDHRTGRRDYSRQLWQLLMLEKSLTRLKAV